MTFSLADALNSIPQAVADTPVLGALASNAIAMSALATAMLAVVATAMCRPGASKFRYGFYAFLGFLTLFACAFYAMDSRARARYGGAASAGIVDSLAAYSGAAEAGRRAPDLTALGAGYGAAPAYAPAYAFAPAYGAYGGSAHAGSTYAGPPGPPSDAPPGFAWVRADNVA